MGYCACLAGVSALWNVAQVQRHDPMARPDLERAIGGEEIKPMQPKKNVRKPVKKRIYQKMKRVDREEAAGDDEIEDIAEEKVVRQAQLQQLEMRADEERDGDGTMEDGGSGAEDDLEYDSDDASVYTATSGVDDYEAYVREEQQISAEEEEAFRLFLDPAAATKKVRTIGDIIAEKMEASAAGAPAPAQRRPHEAPPCASPLCRCTEPRTRQKPHAESAPSLEWGL